MVIGISRQSRNVEGREKRRMEGGGEEGKEEEKEEGRKEEGKEGMEEGREGGREERRKEEKKGRRERSSGPRTQILAKLQVEVHLSTWPRTDVIQTMASNPFSTSLCSSVP